MTKQLLKALKKNFEKIKYFFPRFSPSFICHLVVGIMHFKRKKNIPVFRLDEIRRTDLNKGEEPRIPQLTIISTKLNHDIYRICDTKTVNRQSFTTKTTKTL